MATLTLDRVDKVYRPRRKEPVHAVRSFSMTVADGEIVGLLGSSGCGKTSTLRMIAGFEEVSAGEIRLGQRRIDRLAPKDRNVAMAFEGYALYPPLRIRDNVGFALLRERRSAAEVRRKVDEIAGLLEIGDVLDRYPPTISAGQQQRASLARALIRDADLFLLDEPMGQLEPRLRAILRARIKDWIIQRRLTTIIVTHDQTEALALCDRIAVMEAGVLRQLGTPEELKERPADLFVASFIGEPPMNILSSAASLADGRLRLQAKRPDGQPAFTLELPAGEAAPAVGSRPAISLGIRPHRIRVGADGLFAATVTSNQWLGDQSHLGLDLEGCLLVAVTDGDVAAAPGDRVRLAFPPDAVHLFDTETGQALAHGLTRADRALAAA
jgi:multiple sugar transport system ATP-binding protein